MRHIGVILAAGRGRRMGRTKQLVAWPSDEGPKPLVAAAFDAVRPICDAMVVVVGHEAVAVASALGERAFHVVHADPDAAMFESIRVGLRAAREIDREATVVLQPGDHPEVKAETLKVLQDWSLKRPVRGPSGGRAVIPEFGGRGGHPALIPAGVVEALIRAEGAGGLGAYWAEHPELCVRVPVEDPSVVRDVDTAADLGP
jgi:molybdenum cofactor cytidylyltransferase